MGISQALNIGVNGLNGCSTALSVVSDNVANANTTGYKSNSILFGDLVAGYMSTVSIDSEREGAGSTVLGVNTNFSQGPFIATSSWSDLAVNGKGFFNVRKLDAGTGEPIEGARIYYTRDGSFHVNKFGTLVNNQGYALLNTEFEPIIVEADIKNPEYSNYTVDSAGQIWGTPIVFDESTEENDPVPIEGAKINLSGFPNDNGLIREGGNLYSRGPESKDPVHRTDENQTMFGTFLSFNLEGSNVDLAKEMVNMIVYQASYNANSKSITTSSQLLDTTVNMVR